MYIGCESFYSVVIILYSLSTSLKRGNRVSWVLHKNGIDTGKKKESGYDILSSFKMKLFLNQVIIWK